jgi:hypothetical protein
VIFLSPTEPPSLRAIGTTNNVPESFVELAWAAGFFDGEGTVGAYLDKRRPNYTLRLSVAQVDERLLRRFAVAVGFPNRLIRVDDRTRYRGKQTLICRVEFYGLVKVQAIMAMLWRFLSPVKREQFAVAMRTMRVYYDEDHEWKRGVHLRAESRP